ncbi:MAG TPA: acyl-CoA desaturase, partial [Planctomycetota bacterium]|nr:acyl-CoA desaturase [Planctomycetota bacterium]
GLICGSPHGWQGVLEGRFRVIAVKSGEVRWSPVRSCWLLANCVGAVFEAVPTLTCRSFGVFVVTSAVLLCLGFSVGLHRGVIHRSFKTYGWMEMILMLLATLNGFGGIISLSRMHELRDHWQNQSCAPEFYVYRRGPWRDYLWYLHMDYHGPGRFEPALCRELSRKPLYRFLEKAWLPLAMAFGALLYLIGGWRWVVWGICVRVAVCLTGVWLVNYVCHKHGYRSFRLHGCIEEGRNSLLLGVISMGEGWHNNHHAHPDSAQMGIAWWELDPGFTCIRILERLTLVWDVRTIQDAKPRKGLYP